MYKIHKAQVTQFGPPAIIVTTSYTQSNDDLVVESFCLFPHPYPVASFKSLHYDKSCFEETLLELNDIYAHELGLNQAENDIRDHRESYYSEKPFTIPEGVITFNECTKSVLVNLQMRGSASLLEDIREKTGCETLRKILEAISKLPPVIRFGFINDIESS